MFLEFKDPHNLELQLTFPSIFLFLILILIKLFQSLLTKNTLNFPSSKFFLSYNLPVMTCTPNPLNSVKLSLNPISP